MGKTIQIRDLDDDVYDGLRRRAAEAGVSVPELMRAEASRIAARPAMATWLAQTGLGSSARTEADTIAALDELRGPWPGSPRADADR